MFPPVCGCSDEFPWTQISPDLLIKAILSSKWATKSFSRISTNTDIPRRSDCCYSFIKIVHEARKSFSRIFHEHRYPQLVWHNTKNTWNTWIRSHREEETEAGMSLSSLVSRNTTGGNRTQHSKHQDPQALHTTGRDCSRHKVSQHWFPGTQQARNRTEVTHSY